MRGVFQEDKALWRLALPMILSNVSVPLLGVVDTAVIGHLDSPVYLGGVAVGSMATTFLFMLLLFLRMSTTGLCAQAFGAADRPALARALVQPLIMALLAGAGIILLRQPLSALMLQIVGAEAAIQTQAQLFMHIRWLSAPATLANLVILGWLLGVQYARAPVLLLIVGNAVNIALDLWLVVGLGWKVAGAAWATVIADYVTLLMGGALLLHVMRLRGLRRAHFRHAWRGNLHRLLALNRDIMLRSLLLQLCFASLTVIGARLGADVVAVNAVLMNLLTFTAYALDGFAYAVEAYSGQAFGARDGSALRRVWHAACRQAGAVALLFALAYGLFGRAIVNLLTSLPQVQTLALDYLPWQAVLPLLGVWCYLLDGMFIGATRGADMRNSMAVAALGYGITLLSIPWLGNHGLWLALAVFLTLRGLSLWLIWRRRWRTQRWFPAGAA
ncbi:MULTISPECIES: MATE family efflux transporter DinF [Edwardsiella]|uniref:DNA-damage-inducible protein F n=2 Tax=Edwardsiella anguillarum TaxID=1821960 RepID=A0A076LIN3_9GAMM|nr:MULTISPECIES: MATE family efflux transporter DinF [Edwardsiella]AIJ08435.1 DNA-damage-inducible protein F [Edwardsiella anguillarum ET080813]KAB0588959.1 MATE family efflux transporter DinF [Edwardsiella anguillarum]UBU94808.1 MATE family efflux transporter DinF [Edwardsiella sp. LADL05-105]UOU79394.1 MATE family efflux transporter DinF [Edwardsiella anguillarum]WHP80533.1 MATE family efflux transporter DinF [Edwardsiella anguillarum]